MKRISIALATAIVVIPCITYLWELRYRFDPVLEGEVCHSLACSDDLLLDSAKRAGLGGPSNRQIVLANLREALRRNPSSPNRWCDLGQALRQAGRIDEARYCYSKALEVAPNNPPALWRTALFYLRIKERQSALKYMADLLELAPEYKDLIFSIYVVNVRDMAATLQFGIPKQGAMLKEYFRYVVKNAAPEDVREAWSWVETSGRSDAEMATNYIDLLIAKGESPKALEVWSNAVGNDKRFLHPNLVYNGDFEEEPLNLGLDWTYHSGHSVHVRRVSAPVFTGASSMEIAFDGTENVEFSDLAEDVIIGPGQYHFNAWVRTSELTTDQGIAFRFVDRSNRQSAFTTDMLTQTHDWTPIEKDFMWEGPMRPLRIEVFRRPSWRFDNKIKGIVWIDGLTLTRVTPDHLTSNHPLQLSAK